MPASQSVPPRALRVATAQIWSMETALLLCTCRGHRAEVTDLAVNTDNTLFASSSNDHTVRCWSLQVSASHAQLGGAARGHI